MSESRIIQMLQSGETEKQREAAFEARDGNMVNTVPFLVELLVSPSLGVQEAADMALRKIGGQESIHALIPYLRSDSPQVRNLAMDILRHIGHQDIDSLLTLLDDDDPDMRIFGADILGATRSYLAVKPLCQVLLNDYEVNVRYQAAVSLGELGRVEASECLNKAFSDEEWVQYAVVEALSKLRDESSTQSLIKALTHSSELVTSMIVDALGEMGNFKAVPMLLKKIESSPIALRSKIVRAVVKILGGRGLVYLSGKEREKLSEYLLVALNDDDQDTQDVVMTGLGYVGGEKASARILEITAGLDPDLDADRLEKAEAALVSIGYTRALAEGLLSDNDSKALAAVRALARIGSPQATQGLMAAFENKNRDLQREITRELFNADPVQARDFFLHVLRNHNDGDVIKNSLRFIGYKLRDEECVDELMSFLDHPWDDVKQVALDAVLTIGGDMVAQKFDPMFESQDPTQRLMAVYALGRLGAGKNIQRLKKALTDESADVRKMALEAMATVCPDHEEVIPLAVQAMEDPEKEVRLALVELLGKCPRDESVGYLLKALGDRDEWVRIRAIEALGGKNAGQAVPEIISLWEGSSKLQKIKIIQTLGHVGGQGSFRALLNILDDPDPEIQDAAEKALDELQDGEGES